MSVAPHLHIDVRKDGTSWNSSLDNFVDPRSLIPKGGDMSRDKLTKEDVIELHMAYTRSPANPKGSYPGKDYDWRHVGGPLTPCLHDFRKLPVAGAVDPAVLDKAAKYDKIKSALS